MYIELDPILLSNARLSIMSLLNIQGEADFMFIQKELKITAGNLSTQLNKLQHVDYVIITKQFKGNYPLTICKITNKGKLMLEEFFVAINSYDRNKEKLIHYQIES